MVDYVEILEVVEHFYQTLYRKQDSDQESVRQVLDSVGAKKSADEKLLCDNDILLEEITTAITQIQNNKSSGSDGLTNEFYKAFACILALILRRVKVYGVQAGGTADYGNRNAHDFI